MQAVSEIIRSTLGPRSMLKMLLDPNGGENFLSGCPSLEFRFTWCTDHLCPAGIVLTNDGNAILREIDVSHPAAKVRLPCGSTWFGFLLA